MKLLVVSATEKEIGPFIQLLAKNSDVFPGKIVEVLITGVGAVNTVYHLTKKLQAASFDRLIQAGIAGAFGEQLDLGQVVMVQSDAFGDLGTEANGTFQTIFDAGFGSKDEMPFINGWLVNEEPVDKISLPLVKAVSINKVTDSLQQQQQLVDAFNPGIESMEGAAFHYVCLQEKIPFIQLRAISNYVGERDKQHWKMKEAVENLNTTLERIITGS